jgi:hypothetical protein
MMGACGSASRLDSLVRGKEALPGVIGEASYISVVVTDRFRILRLEEEKFFRIVVGGGIGLLRKRAGYCGTAAPPSSLACDSANIEAGVAGD